MAETNESGPSAETGSGSIPTTITQGQTTSVAEDGAALEERPVDSEQTAAAPASDFWSGNTLLYLVIGLWVWYLFGNKKRRQAKAQEKKDQERRNALRKGDRIVTIGRMHAEVTAFTEHSVTVRPDAKSDCAMTFERGAILKVLPRPDEEAAEATAGTGKG